MGPMTGRAAGFCAGYQVPGCMNPMVGGYYGGAVGPAYTPAPFYGSGYGYPYAPAYGPVFGYRAMPGYGWGGYGRGFRGAGYGRGMGRGFRGRGMRGRFY
jgi:hypothetical protein